MYEKKEMEKKIEQVMRQIVLFGLSTSLLKNQKQAAKFEIMPAGSNHLIPRVVVTNIMVYMMSDVRMNAVNASNGRRHRTNNSQQHQSSRSANGANRQDLPLHVAVDNRQKEKARCLIEKCPEALYALDSSKISPLYLAVVCFPKDLEFVKWMLQKPVKLDAYKELQKGKSIVRAAIENKNKGMLDTILGCQHKLIECKDEEGLTPLSYAASKGDADIVGYIMEKFPNSMKLKNKDGTLPIHKACLGGHVQVLKMFDPNYLKVRDEKGRTILHLAAIESSNKLMPVVEYLLRLPEGRELMNQKDENLCEPLKLAKNDQVKNLLQNASNSRGN